MQPYLTPRLHHLPAAETPSSGVALEVRLGSGRPARYELDGTDFLIGGAANSDIRLPGPNSPATVCRLIRTPETLAMQRLDPAFPVLWNGKLIPGNSAVRLSHGDRVAVGPIDLTIELAGIYLHPEAHTPAPPSPEGTRPFRPEYQPTVTAPRQEPPPTYGPDMTALANERESLKRERAELQAKAEELEADRALWYKRRQQWEQEWNGGGEREAALNQRAADLDQFQAELSSMREQLAAQYDTRRQQLTQMQNMLSGTTADLNSRREQLEREAADLAQRRVELEEAHRVRLAALEYETTQFRQQLVETETQKIQQSLLSTPTINGKTLAEREAEWQRDAEDLKREREQFSQELLRFERRQTGYEQRQQEVEARTLELDRRDDQFLRDKLAIEEREKLLTSEEARLKTLASEQAQKQAELDALSANLAERAGQIETQQARLAVVRASLDRQQEEMKQTAEKLAADRIRLDEIQHQLDDRLREAEKVRVTLFHQKDTHETENKAFAERQKLLEATLAELHEQRNQLVAENERLQAKDHDINGRTAQFAEQTATLQARAKQLEDFQARLEADRTALEARVKALAESDTARQTFQEQLRRRAEELAARTKALDESTQRLTAEKSELDQLRGELGQQKQSLLSSHAVSGEELQKQLADIAGRESDLVAREANLERQSLRLREVGKVVATQKRDFVTERETWATTKQAELQKEAAARQDFEAFHAQAIADLTTLQQQAPKLYDQARDTMQKLTSARDVIRGHLGELHGYAGQTRQELETARAELRAEALKLDEREQMLEKARAEHRLAVAEFRQQALEWQSKILSARSSMTRNETQLESRQAEIQAAAKQVDATTIKLAHQADELRVEKQRVAERRGEVEQHLSDLREWYRRKLKEIVGSRGGDNEPPVVLPLTGREELDPGDKQLGERLRSLELVDSETLNTLWAEARRQRRPLRSVLLAGGAVTLYQLAMMETGNLNSLILGRFRVIDRLRVTPREVVFRVVDPARSGGVFTLRHLAEAEMEDAVRPDEFRQMFSAARDSAHPNLAATVEVLEVQNRPAAILEYVPGLPSSEWPAEAATPGAWVWLLLQAASGLDAAHRHGLVHGRLSSDTFLMTADGTIKLVGIGEPMWLATGMAATFDPTPEADLRALGQVSYAWTQLSQPANKRRTRSKSFPESLVAVIRRLEADPETPMGDTAPGAMPYRTAADLVADLTRLANIFPCPPEAKAALLAAATPDAQPGARQSA
ncbi:MAG: hypothetical protein ACRC8S_18985 [Fimbriiglobus sp.]